MPTIGGTLRDKLRTLLKIRKDRSLQRRGPKPSIGARITRGDFRMTVQAGMPMELWNWLQSQGWREVTFKGDRRRYSDISTDWAMQLIDAPAERRQQVLEHAIAAAEARARPTEAGGSSTRPSGT